MKSKRLGILLVSLLLVPVFLNYGSPINASAEQESPDIFIGVDVAYENLTEIKKLIDEVGSYTNLFVIGCTGITQNMIWNATTGRIITEDFTKLDDTCQYIYDKGLSFIIYRDRPLQTEWLENATKRWGDRFLGIYAFDENGGYQLDDQEYKAVLEADNYTEASTQFVNNTNRILDRYFKRFYTNSTSFPLFTSDYAFYWFDYKAGYDVLLAQLGWNYSRQLNVALCRGAATVQNKDWGVIIAWTYTDPPYIESGEELYADLILAYENGAKYIVILDTNEDYTQGILEQEHLNALKQFWQYIQDNPRKSDSTSDRVAYVLPKDYGYGFRGPNDKIWGLWEADALSNELCKNLNSLLEEHGTKLDIIYDDGLQPDNTYGYSKLIFWNSSDMPILTPYSVYALAVGIAITVVAAAALVLRKRR